MPKQTFLNLPEEKRNTIIDVAINEFSEYGLENASTNRIVEKSGISKGSFYQYFEDKQDVFMHLVSILEHEKMEYFKDPPPPSMNMDAFEYYHWMVKAGMAFNSTKPKMAQAISRVIMRERSFSNKFFDDAREKTKAFFEDMIEKAIERGEIDPSIDVELAVMVMEAWQNTITTYIMDEGMKQEDFMAWVYSAKTQEMIDKLLYVMEYGLRKTESEFEKAA
ncbi:MAG: TetR/AcrR family transcriptional regulator [Anaerolineae bacterium]|jgi:AcrR family transcriptional regulator|nr:TetR/AcrR family transcriptional regulator [Anaerolineae bacterium]MBT3712426.1 TetR/AcrR family transcriptional regulator [Anaerolineae bacterium]MBT4312091.1 TetR/AcrR family transcriptional regulator [Anaerolineae bacterium]MBT4457142.1 TetR/AcrR family transcriptional regulator [Anaerolineae bacterium]MBT4843101.1 TetR/AcrR family transcriptional regulator [Anaerolineae bacterium]